MGRVLAVFALALCSLAIEQAAALAQTKPVVAESTWRMRTIKSEMDDSLGVVYTVSASNIVSSRLKTHRPELLIRCLERRLQVSVDFGMAATAESGDARTVRIRFDEGTADTQSWEESADKEALVAPDPGAFIQSVVQARLLRVQFTPFKGSPEVVRFNVAGFAPHVPELAKRCGPPRSLDERVAGTIPPKESTSSKSAVKPVPPPPAPAPETPRTEALAPKPPVAASEFVRLALNGTGPYVTALFHQLNCEWIVKSGGGTLTLWRSEAERARFQPHHACMKTTPQPIVSPVKPLTGKGDPRWNEMVIISLGQPAANGFYHSPQCATFPAGPRRSVAREEAVRRHYLPHPECIDRGAR